MTVTLSAPQIVGLIAGLFVIGATLIGIGKWIGSVNSDRKTFKDFMQEIREKIDDILLRLPRKPPSILLESKSPLGLNKKGQEISKELNAVAWAKKNAEKVLVEVREKDAYDIQEFSFKYATKENHYTLDELALIRKVAYQNGVFEGDVQIVLAIELRDELLELRGMEAQ
ncbi:MAG: hypothetical protein OXI05_07635 [Bacteroidota bacterium]|nr:hypothetical protein [Bacteroidota bacterium]